MRPPVVNMTAESDGSVAAPAAEGLKEVQVARPQPQAPPAATPAEPPKPQGPPLLEPREPISTAQCPMRWTPTSLHASVIVYPAEIAGRFIQPMFDAACACTREGERVLLLARVVPERGEMTIETAVRTDPETRVEPNVNQCITTFMKGKKFEPFEVPSDVVCPDEPKIDPPPRGTSFFKPPRRAGCQKSNTATSLIVYPLLVNRAK